MTRWHAEGGASEETSWTRVRDGDLEYVVRRFWKSIHAFLAPRLGSPEAAEDATQEFFLRFVRSGALERIDPARGRCRSFIFHAVRQFLIDRQRAQARERARTAPDTDLETRESDTLSPEDAFDACWFRTLLDTARRQVKAAHLANGNALAYRAFKLHYYGSGADGGRWSQRRIAGELGVTQASVNNWLHRSRKMFARAVQGLIADTCAPGDVAAELLELARHDDRRLWQIDETSTPA